MCARTIGMQPGQCNVQDECYLLGYHRLADVLRGWRKWWERTDEYADPASIYETTCAALAEPGRSVSGRPPAAVASAGPELAELLLEALDPRHSDTCICVGCHNWRVIRSALSRLAGQAATANESGGAARGQTEEER